MQALSAANAGPFVAPGENVRLCVKTLSIWKHWDICMLSNCTVQSSLFLNYACLQSHLRAVLLYNAKDISGSQKEIRRMLEYGMIWSCYPVYFQTPFQIWGENHQSEKCWPIRFHRGRCCACICMHWSAASHTVNWVEASCTCGTASPTSRS